MFFCEGCRTKKDWPESVMRSRGKCEVCGEEGPCNDVASKFLPKRKKEIGDAPAFSCTLGQISDAGFWLEYCEETGANEWYFNEGGDRDVTVRLPLSSGVAKLMFQKFTAR